ncbi:hypothetical protein SAMN05421503_1449 [Terribacillus aidingensis]|uniref:Uncharacterized protein n=1 Tax=Terribacillus aidingensis TaxID=586416 RepID=A0A285NKG2_9BACI|nr:hypothetical protein [Terribacillus aidingensis]SNZ09982.1 hypothetical protein SAMN05421503_1449 [Terribacillus aidingensis]
MNTDGLKEGLIIKNYKELCSLLKIEFKTSSKNREYQLKELSRYCMFTKQGHKYLINDVYNTPLPKQDNRGLSKGSRGNRNVYGDYLQMLILELLIRSNSGKELLISRSRLMKALKVVNENYHRFINRPDKLSEVVDIKTSTIKDFYATTDNNLKNAIETALKKLQNKRLLMYKTSQIVVTQNNELREPTYEEAQLIMNLEKTVLNTMGYGDIDSVRKSSGWELFKENVKELLAKNSEISYYFNAYHITLNENHANEEHQQLANQTINVALESGAENVKKVNKKVIESLNKNAARRHAKGFLNGKSGKVRSEESYPKDVQSLTSILIDRKADTM